MNNSSKSSILRASVPLVLVVVAACGAPAGTAPDTTTAVVALDTITAPAEVTVEAARATTAPIVAVDVPAFDCATYVNGLPYAASDPVPAREAYRVAASCRGWSQETIAKWEYFIVDDVIAKESGFCWNVRGGAVFAGVGCELARQGTREDSGWGQLIGLWYRPGGPLCEAEGMCSSNAIIASPWASMNALLFAVEHDGRGPWSWDAWAKSFHPSYVTVTRYWP